MRPKRALLLAGARPEPDPAAAYAGVSHKALIELAGAPLLARVATALADAGFIWITVVTSDPDVARLATSLGASVLPAESGPSLSVLKGVETVGAPVLVTTSDHA